MMPPAEEQAAASSTMSLARLQSTLRAFQSSGKAFELVTGATTPPPPRACSTLIVLDSSFNPPTIAHLAMATSALDDLHTQRSIAAKLKGSAPDAHGDGIRLLLLLAVNNADKAPKPASFEHRLLLMQHFAADIQHAWREARRQEDSGGGSADVPVDIGLTTHPYFHDKSAAIARADNIYTFEPSGSEQIFLAGYDTLIRIFNPKYYTTSNPDATPMQTALDPFLARARLRVTMRTDAGWGDRKAQEGYIEGLLQGDELERVGGRPEWATKVQLLEGLEGKDGLVLSSTEARAAVGKADWKLLRRLVPEGVARVIETGQVEWLGRDCS